MKKILSVILMLAMLTAPVGATSCFAAGGAQPHRRMVLAKYMKEQGFGKVRLIATLLINGRMSANIVYFNKNGRFLESANVTNQCYAEIAGKFRKMRVFEKLRALNLDIAQVIYESDDRGNLSWHIYYLDSEGRIEHVE